MLGPIFLVYPSMGDLASLKGRTWDAVIDNSATDPKWVKENGHTPTLMDYSRFNYVAQPGDNPPPPFS